MSNTTPLFKEMQRLHALGFATLWLHPKSKRPIGNEWAKGPRKSLKELRAEYKNGFNVGVRLGSPSRIQTVGEGACYLAVVDVDIKSTDPRHHKEALHALRELMGKKTLPEVQSGRGNGSRHLYCLTREPFKTWNPAESDETVRVFIPSKSPSKRELAELTEAEIKQGWRLSRAWEISLYSEGRQVVLPPSIHPDSGKQYSWSTPFLDAAAIPIVKFKGAPRWQREYSFFGESKNDTRAEVNAAVIDFEIDEGLDVRWLPDVADSVRKLIVSGVWKGKKVEDRSAMLLPAATGLVSAGLGKNEILTVLTDRTTYLGECAYDHAQTKNRKRAALWLWNYTVKNVMGERNARTAFAGVAVTDDTLDEEDAARQAEEIESDIDWKQNLDKTEKGQLKATLNNCIAIIENSCGGPGVVGRDEFAVQDYYKRDTPWRSKNGDAVIDMDVVRIKVFIATNFGIEFNDNTINQALLDVADVNRFHPVREYLKGLEWDGVTRCETWLKDYANAVGPERYLRAVSRKVLVAMVKRVFEPGCQFDQVLILEGNQGAGKSSLLAKLAGKWFTDQALVIGDKDAVLTIQSKWLIELGELASLNRSEIEAMKAFLSQRTDRIRAPYGKRTEEYPRQSIFVGSTNLDEYLKDETGNRRFWPVRCEGKLRHNELAVVRDQLFAEAYALYRFGEPIYLEREEEDALAIVEQAKRGEVDEWFGAVADVVSGEMFPRKGFEMRQLASQLDQFGAHKLDKSDQMRIAKILRALGFERYQENRGARRKLWRAGPKYVLGDLPPEKDQLSLELAGTSRNHLGGSLKTPMIQDFY